MPDKDQPIEEAIRKVTKGRKIGRKKVIKKLSQWSSSRVRRVYQQKGFSMFIRPRKGRIKRSPNPLEPVFSPNEQWAMDFMSDALINGRRIRTFNIVDHYNRECKGILVSTSLPSNRIIEQLNRIIEREGKPKSIRTDNGPEFVSKKFQLWMKDRDIRWSPIQKGKPAQNGIIERFNRTYREQILDQNLLKNVEHAQQITDQWVEEYNYGWHHESLGFKTPKEYAA